MFTQSFKTIPSLSLPVLTEDWPKTRNLFAVLLLGLACLSSCQHLAKPVASPDTTARAVPVLVEMGEPAQITLQFVGWYQTHYTELSALALVNQPADTTTFYSVNEKATRRYVAQLKSSQLVSPAYLTYWETYFREAEQRFQANPQNDGPPEGFEYDLVLQTQEIEVEHLSQARVSNELISGNKATVTVQLPGSQKLHFTLQKQQNCWLIDRIEAG